jgi:hypothetical protein
MPGNNAQQAYRDSPYFLVRPQSIKVPSHYVFQLIISGFSIVSLTICSLSEHRWVTFNRMSPAPSRYFNCLSKRVDSGEINPWCLSARCHPLAS